MTLQSLQLHRGFMSLNVPFSISRPAEALSPVVFASPHSGCYYPPSLIECSSLTPYELRLSEDAFVDDLFEGVTTAGAPLISAHFPRAYIDVNREPYELDPEMFEQFPTTPQLKVSTRAAHGLGTIPRLVSAGKMIYDKRLPNEVIEQRLEACYWPYHQALDDLLSEMDRIFGQSILVDCHSMPSPLVAGQQLSNIVLGTRHDTSCTRRLADFLESKFRELGYTVSRDHPYAGGYCTIKHGNPLHGRQAIQIEIHRAIYMNELTLRPKEERYRRLKNDLSFISNELCRHWRSFSL